MRSHRWQIQHLPQVDSTQDLVRERLSEEPDLSICVRADRQELGRGRRGRTWQSPLGGLWCSFNLAQTQPDPFHTLLLASATTDSASTLCQTGASSPRIKWPNDLIIGDRKWGGILAEVSSPPARSTRPASVQVVFGLGLNLNLSENQLATVHGDPTAPPGGVRTSAPPTARPRIEATSLRIEFGANPSPSRMLSDILSRFEAYLERDEREGRAASRERVSTQLSTLGRRVSWLDARGHRQEALAVGLDDGGGLVVQRANGQTEVLFAGDVSHVR